MTSKGSRLRTVLVRPILARNPSETLKYLLPQTCERIEKIIDDAQTTIYTNYEGDAELSWCLVLFSELLRARGETLLPYKSMIFSVFRRSVHLIHVSSYLAVADAAKDFLKSLTYVYPIEFRLTLKNIEEPFTDALPIRVSLEISRAVSHHTESRPGVNECNYMICNLNFIFPLAKKWMWPANLSKPSSIPNWLCWTATARSYLEKNERDRFDWSTGSASVVSEWHEGFRVRKSKRLLVRRDLHRWSPSNRHTMFTMLCTWRNPVSRFNHDFQPNVSFIEFQENLRMRLIVEMGTLLGWWRADPTIVCIDFCLS